MSSDCVLVIALFFALEAAIGLWLGARVQEFLYTALPMLFVTTAVFICKALSAWPPTTFCWVRCAGESFLPLLILISPVFFSQRVRRKLLPQG